jgi:membrane-associated protease RseP (regulator of RpoE activity)
MSLRLRNLIEWALMVALVCGGGLVAQAQNQDKDKGHIVQIGPDKSKDTGTAPTENDPATTTNDGQQAAVPHYWLGLMGGPIPPELRAHLDVPENLGIMVHSVVPDSPAAKAGLKNFDIVLKANDADIKDMRDLMDLVKTAGEQKASLSLEVLRKGGRETVTVTPAERPAHVAIQQPMPGQEGQGGFGGGVAGVPGVPNDMMQWFQQFRGDGHGNQPFAFRQFGPGVVVNGQPFGGAATIPNGVSVSITKQNNQPAHVTVKRGNDSWEVVGDDPASLQQLPEDLRPFIEQMLNQSEGRAAVNIPQLPQGMQQLGEEDQNLQQRLDTLEQQLKDLQQRLGGDKPAEGKTLP